MELQRNNGYIDLNTYFLSCYGIEVHTLKDLEGIISLEQLGSRNKFWFDFLGMKAMYKEQYQGTLEAYAELVIAELIQMMAVPHLKAADYDLASLTYDGVPSYGVVTRNFKKEHCQYLTGSDIIVSVYNQYIKNNPTLLKEFGVEGLSEAAVLNQVNNFEDLWAIFSMYFSGYDQRDEIVANLMDSLVSLYMFDALTIQGDRHSDNWSIEINENHEVSLAPIYDSSNSLNFNRKKAVDLLITNFQAYHTMNAIKKPRLFRRMLGQVYHPSTLFTVQPREDLKKKMSCLDVLEDFISLSSSQYQDRLFQMIAFFKEGGLEKVYQEIERKIGQPVPDHIKYYLNEIFSLHVGEIEKRFDIENWKVRGASL